MNITPIIFFDMAATIFILSIALVAVVFYLSAIIKKQHDKEPSKDLSYAKLQAVKMIDEANSKALDIINKANLSTDIASENFNQEIANMASLQVKEFEKVTSDFIKLYSQVLHDLKSKNIEVFQKVSKDIEINTVAEIKSFKESMEKLTASSQKIVKKKIDTDYEATKKEIVNYKEKELKKIDDEIYLILERISKLALGRTLSLSEHEDLIEKSLEKAKKEGLFNK